MLAKVFFVMLVTCYVQAYSSCSCPNGLVLQTEFANHLQCALTGPVCIDKTNRNIYCISTKNCVGPAAPLHTYYSGGPCADCANWCPDACTEDPTCTGISMNGNSCWLTATPCTNTELTQAIYGFYCFKGRLQRYDAVPVDTTFSAVCNDGYELKGAAQYTCRADLTIEPTEAPKCMLVRSGKDGKCKGRTLRGKRGKCGVDVEPEFIGLIVVAETGGKLIVIVVGAYQICVLFSITSALLCGSISSHFNLSH